MTGAIDTFLLYRRPLTPAFGPIDNSWEVALAAALSEHRSEIVSSGVRGLRNLVESRVKEYRDTAAHYRAHFHDEGMYDRFTGYAVEEEKAVAWADRLLAKIAEHGLPEAVVAYDPLGALM